MDALQVLAHHSFTCRAFCASKLDASNELAFDQFIADLRRSARTQQIAIGDKSVAVWNLARGRVSAWVFPTQSPDIYSWAEDEPQAMLGACDRVLGSICPDVLLTYGGHPVALAMMQMARRRKIPVVFGLHNLDYDDIRAFECVDHVVVPSTFAQVWYRERLGLSCHVLPNLIDPKRVEAHVAPIALRPSAHSAVDSGQSEIRTAENAEERRGGYVTFVNPQPSKGLFVFARIAEGIARRRPDIAILVVESRGQAAWLEQTNVDLSWATNLHAMENTPDPRDYYRGTKLLLMPSLVPESFGLVAAEAMINGIPVLASNRGALPETIGAKNWELGINLKWRHRDGAGIERCPSGSFILDIPERYSPETVLVPTAEEVEPWVETIIRLWDDESLYRECSEEARAHAQQWHPDRLGPMYAEFFRNVRPRRGPPIVPREVRSAITRPHVNRPRDAQPA
jgi:glycosyltransferase involved in cell wall biosynthesis